MREDDIPTLKGLLVEGPSRPWERIGFAIADGRFEVGGVTFALTGREPGGIRAWHLDVKEPVDVEGLRHEPVAAAPPTSHPNGTVALDHVVVTTPDLERTTTALARLGLMPHRTVEGIPGRGDHRFRFFLLGTSVLELIGPATPGGDRPARFAGIAFATGRLDELDGELGPLLGDVHDAIQPGRRIASVKDEAGLGVPVAFMTPRS